MDLLTFKESCHTRVVLRIVCISCLLLSTSSDPGLVSTVPGGSRVYIDQPITITCVARGTQILAWQSDEYIGLGGQLAFGSGDRPGRIINSQIMNNTFAVLTRNSMEGGEPQLESRLRLTVASEYQSFTVTCRSVDQGRADNITYYKSDEAATQLQVFLPNETLYQTNNPTLNCTARNTSIVILRSSVYNGSVQCQRDDPPIRNQTIGDVGLVVKTKYSNAMLTCGLTIKTTNLRDFSTNHQVLNFTCLNVDIGVSAIATVELSGVCSAGDTTTPGVDTELSTLILSSDAIGSTSAMILTLLISVTQSFCVRKYM